MENKPLILFKADSHSYFYDKYKLTSANGITKYFTKPFDEESWLTNKVLSNNIDNYYRMYFRKYDFEDKKPSNDTLMSEFGGYLNVDCLGEEYAKAKDELDLYSINGTKFHDRLEKRNYERGYAINPFFNKKFKVNPKPLIPDGYQNATIFSDLSKLKDGCYLELLVFSLPHLLCGQIDEVFIETLNGIRYIDINDHKTNKKKPVNTKKGKFCKPPISNLIDSKYTKYQLQISLYAYMLELAGFKVRHLAISHYSNYDESTKKVITMKYLNKEVKNMFDFWEDFCLDEVKFKNLT